MPSSGDEAAADGNSAGGDEERSSDASKARTDLAPAADANVRVEPPSVHHEDWAAWFRHLEEYSHATKQLIRVQEVMSCAQRNKRLKSSKAAMRGERLRLVPEDWRTYQRTYICTHGWRPRKRGEPQRRRRILRSTDCPFRFVVQVVERGSGWCLKVKNGLFQHNHNVDDDQFGTYPMPNSEDGRPARVQELSTRVASTADRSTSNGFAEEEGESGETTEREPEEEDVDDEGDRSYEPQASAPASSRSAQARTSPARHAPSTSAIPATQAAPAPAASARAGPSERAPAPFASPQTRLPGMFTSPPGRSSIGSRRVSLSSSHGGDELEWETERRRRVELEEREVELRVESLHCDNVLKRIRIVEESMLARKRLRDAGISEAEINALIPVVAVPHPELDANSGLRQLGTPGQTPEKQT